jgi:hypothetical protein
MTSLTFCASSEELSRELEGYPASCITMGLPPDSASLFLLHDFSEAFCDKLVGYYSAGGSNVPDDSNSTGGARPILL